MAPDTSAKLNHKGEKWSRVIVATQSIDLNNIAFDVDEDLNLLHQSGALKPKPKPYSKPWRPIFQSAGQSSVVTAQDLAKHKLSREQLFSFALQINAL